MVNRDKGLIWKTGEFDTSMLSNEYYYFKLIEDEINIQDIEELDIYEENVTKGNIIDKINDIVIGLKYIDNKIKEK